MTIVVGVAAPDGLILAGDSRTTARYQDGGHRILSDFAHKVFGICGFGVATYGHALIDDKTIAGTIGEFTAQLPERPKDLDEISIHLGDFFQPRLLQWYEDLGEPWDEESDEWQLGFLVAGYDNAGVGGLREVRIPGVPEAEILELDPTTKKPGFTPKGMNDVVNRLIAGFDLERLALSGVPISEQMAEALSGLEYIMLEPLSMQDAVDLAHFFIRTTVDMQRFSHGTHGMPGAAPSCGGPISTLAVTRSGCHWVEPRKLSASIPGWAEGAR